MTKEKVLDFIMNDLPPYARPQDMSKSADYYKGYDEGTRQAYANCITLIQEIDDGWHIGIPTIEGGYYLVVVKSVDGSSYLNSNICYWKNKKKSFNYWSDYSDRDIYIKFDEVIKWKKIDFEEEEEND